MKLIAVLISSAIYESSTIANLQWRPMSGITMPRLMMNLVSQLTPDKPVMITNPTIDFAYKNLLVNEVAYIDQKANGNIFSVIYALKSHTAFQGTTILVLPACMPLLSPPVIRRLVKKHGVGNKKITFLVVNPNVNKQGDPDTRKQPHTWLPFLFDPELLNSELFLALAKTAPTYPDIAVIKKIGQTHHVLVDTQKASQRDDLLVVRSEVEFAQASACLRGRVNEQLMLSGVTIVDPATTYIDVTAKIGRGTTVQPNTHISGTSTVGEDCIIGPNTVIDASSIGDRCRVLVSVLEDAVMENDTDIGPFSHLRKGAYVCSKAHIGNFAEIKNSTLGAGTRMGHFSYLGDATVGADTNIGAGTITCNFDGIEKHKTRIGDNAFIGSGTMIVAPADIGNNTKTGAGSVVTHNLPDNTLAYGVPAKIKKKEDAEQD